LLAAGGLGYCVRPRRKKEQRSDGDSWIEPAPRQQDQEDLGQQRNDVPNGSQSKPEINR
jgi:hypothetical protein